MLSSRQIVRGAVRSKERATGPRAFDRAPTWQLAVLAIGLGGCGVCEPVVFDGAVDGAVLGPVDAGADGAARGDSAPPEDAWTPPPTHDPLPIVPDQGGLRITHPRLVLITYDDDPGRAALEAHARWMVGSSWWATIGPEYGVGGATVEASVVLPGPAPELVTASDVRALLAARIADGTLPTAPDGGLDDVVYLFYVPPQTVVTDPELGVGCHGFAGYHSEGTTMGRAFSFGVVLACAGASSTLSDLESEERAAGHELVEAVTDPRPTSAPAFLIPEAARPQSPWVFVGPELADLCELREGERAIVRDSGFVAPRVWSNAAAMAGDRDPCVPMTAGPYRGLTLSPSTVVSAAPGSSTSFVVTAWSTAAVAPFGLLAMAGPGTFSPGLAIDRASIAAGEQALLTVTVPDNAPSGGHAVVFVDAVVGPADFEAFPVVVSVP